MGGWMGGWVGDVLGARVVDGVGEKAVVVVGEAHGGDTVVWAGGWVGGWVG